MLTYTDLYKAPIQHTYSLFTYSGLFWHVVCISDRPCKCLGQVHHAHIQRQPVTKSDRYKSASETHCNTLQHTATKATDTNLHTTPAFTSKWQLLSTHIFRSLDTFCVSEIGLCRVVGRRVSYKKRHIQIYTRRICSLLTDSSLFWHDIRLR